MNNPRLTRIAGGMRESPVLRIPNHAYAAGRIGLAVVLAPLLIGMGFLLAVSDHQNIAVGAVLVLLSIPFLWIAFTTPTLIDVDEKITVHFLFREREYSPDDILGFSETTETTRTLTPESNFGSPSLRRDSRRYNVGVMRLRKGSKLKFQISPHQAQQLREFLGTD